ncbi:MAG: molybdopterin molybdotransferase MoeA [Chloroflexia bacterium]|nr:molybdopterin molybdotransferase MoeA [Chloroflexia bacterium]
MLSVDQARARVLAAFAPLPPVDLPLLAARGLVLTDSVTADCDVPPFRNSAMDGYAVLAAETAGASIGEPVRLRVAGMVAAGSPEPRSLEPAAAIRIMTGAAMPDGADAVVRFEETDEGTTGSRSDERGEVLIVRPARPGDNVRPAGEDVAKGTALFPAGRRLRPADLGLLAALGRTSVRVHRRPRVALLSTGDEVVPPEEALAPGLIRDSNTTTLAAMAAAWGAEVIGLGIAGDRLDDLRQRLRGGQRADLIVTSGGVSVGDYDLVKDALQAEGDVAIWQVRMKPGKPLAFGHAGNVPLLGLPGNPVAAAVSFEVFGHPAIRKMLGFRDVLPASVKVTLVEPLDNRGMRRHYVRATIERDGEAGWTARTAGAQGAGVLSSLSRANALLVVPEELERAEPGMRLEAILLDPTDGW